MNERSEMMRWQMQRQKQVYLADKSVGPHYYQAGVHLRCVLSFQPRVTHASDWLPLLCV